MPEDSFTLLYDALFRTFRNATFAHVRHALKENLGDTWEEELRKLFKNEQWEEAGKSVRTAHTKAISDAQPKDLLDYLDVPQLKNIIEKWGIYLIPDHHAPTEDQKKSAKKALTEYISDIGDFRHPTAHPTEEDIDPFDAFRAIDSAIRASKILGLHQTATELHAHRQKIIPALHDHAATEPTTVVENLPSREAIVADFVGRTEELSQLWDWLLDPHSHRWLLTGEGGKGKTAIAYEFASQVATSSPTNLTALHWMTGKKWQFREGETFRVTRPDFWDLDSALESLISTYGESTALQGASTEAKRDAVLRLLREFPSLIVVDDLDTASYIDDDIIPFFIFDVAETGSTKLLVTSRQELGSLSRSKTQVKGLELHENGSGPAKQFLLSRANRLGLDTGPLTNDRIHRIWRLSEGSPLYMEDMLRLFRFYKPDKAIEQWRSRGGDAAREYALQREVETLTDAARTCLDVFALAGQPLNIEELRSILGLQDDEQAMQAVTELRKLYLVPGMTIVEDVPRYEINPNLATFVKSNVTDPARRAELQNAIQGALGKLPQGAESREVADYCRQAMVFLRNGQPERAEETVLKGLEHHPNRSGLYEVLGRVRRFHRPPRAIEAREAFSRAHELGLQSFELYEQWSALEIDASKWEEAARVAELGVDRLDRDPRLLQRAGYARSRLANALFQRLDEISAQAEAERADRLLRQARDRFLKHGGDPAWRGKAYRALIINAQRLGRQDWACDRLGEWLEEMPYDSHAWREYRRQAEHCPQLQDVVARLQSDGYGI